MQFMSFDIAMQLVSVQTSTSTLHTSLSEGTCNRGLVSAWHLLLVERKTITQP